MRTFDETLLSGRVQALRSVWCWYKPDSLLIDCGDGCTVDLGRHVGSPRVLAFTHGHSDHILGLPNFMLARQMPSMVSGSPITILYPAGTQQLEALRAGIHAMWSRTVFDRIVWQEMRPGDRFVLGPTRDLVAFATNHLKEGLSLGYAVVEHRWRLPERLKELSGRDIARLAAAEGRDAVRERVEVADFVHTGDTMPCDIPWIKGAGVAIVDATFLDAKDRESPTHATVAEAMTMGEGAEHVVLHHISQRYPRVSLVSDVRERVIEAGFDPARVTLWEDTTWTALAK